MTNLDPSPPEGDEPPAPPRSASWADAPSWSTRRHVAAAEPPPAPRGTRAAPIVLLALVGGVVAGALSGLAVVNLAMPTAVPGTPAPGGTVVSNVRIDESSAVIDAVDRVAPAVVVIRSTSSGPLGGTGTGSGFIFDPNGWILTNKHVVAGAEQIQVELQDSRTFVARLVGVDTLTDLAIIKINASGLPTAPIGSSGALELGQLAIAIGNPLGTYQYTVTTGVVSGLGRQIEAGDASGGSAEQLNHLIQTDAAINPGNSGGPLINSVGQVIGINTAVASSAQGIGFAIPIDFAKPIMALALDGREIARPWVGVRYTVITRQLAADRDLPVETGALISAASNGEPAVFPGSPAELAGLQEGDIITKVNGHAVDIDHDVATLLLPHVPGDTVTMEVIRGDQTLQIAVTLGTLPADL